MRITLLWMLNLHRSRINHSLICIYWRIVDSLSSDNNTLIYNHWVSLIAGQPFSFYLHTTSLHNLINSLLYILSLLLFIYYSIYSNTLIVYSIIIAKDLSIFFSFLFNLFTYVIKWSKFSQIYSFFLQNLLYLYD